MPRYVVDVFREVRTMQRKYMLQMFLERSVRRRDNFSLEV